MSTANIIEIGVALIALVIVALSSWTETCLSAVSRVNIRRLLDDRYARADEHAIERAQALRSSILLIELLAAGLAAALIVSFCRAVIGPNGSAIGLAVVAVALVVIGRIVPRVLAGEEPDGDAPAVSRIARMLVFSFAPIVRPVEWLIDALARGRERREAPTATDISTGDVATLPSSGDRERHEDDPIEDDEQEMISGILHLERATARDIMVPRIDVVGTSREVLVSEAVDIAMQAGHSRIPVYGRSVDEILGVLYVKDLLRYVNDDHEGITIEELMRPAYFVPESKRVDDLLNDLQQQKVHLAVVVDEYGGTAGVVTIEDILEEIVGEIQDEFDPESRRIDILNDNEAVADGALSIDDLSDEMGLEWPEQVSGTIGGYIQRQLGRIPSEGEVVQIAGIRLTVLSAEHRRVRQVRVERLVQDLQHVADDESPVSPSA